MEEHIKRSHHQTNVRLQADVAFPKQESSVGNGWYKDPQSGRFHPKLMVSDAFPKDFTDIVHCQNCSMCGVLVGQII